MKDGRVLYTTEQLIKDIEVVDELVNRFKNIVWGGQAPDFNCDKIPKPEQIQLIGLYKDAGLLYNKLIMYKQLFRNE